MLNLVRRLRTLFVLLGLATVLATVAVAFTSTPATAGPENCQPPNIWAEVTPGFYGCTIVGNGGDDGEDGGSGGTPAEPQCNLSYNEGAYLGLSPDNSGNYCKGTRTCFNVAHFGPNVMPEGDKPNEDSKARIEYCFTTPFDSVIERIYWTDDAEPPSLLEQSRTAIGQITVPAPTVNVSPAGRTLVNLDTWFWTTGLPQQATGSSAFGLVAIAFNPRISVSPGDGSAAFGCPYVTDAAAAEQSCHHEYVKASLRGSASVDGRPAYGVEINTVYDLRFEVYGNPVTIDGAQTTFDGPPGQSAVRVDEVQTLSRPNR